MRCEVCGGRTFKTKHPLAMYCSTCQKNLCPSHAHFYVDGNNRAISASARPNCATCAGMVTIHCFWGTCDHIVEHRDPVQGSRIMEAHYQEVHPHDLTKLGFPPSERCGAHFGSSPTRCDKRAGHEGGHTQTGALIWADGVATYPAKAPAPTGGLLDLLGEAS